jgi:hypothetical protein
LTDPFFRREGDRYVPSTASSGPWDPNSLHGRVVAGLLARELENVFGDPAFQFARLTVDMFRLPKLDALKVSSQQVRAGNRIRVADATIFQYGEEVARARGVLLRRADNPSGEVWKPEPWDVPAPASIPQPEGQSGPGGKGAMWDTRPITGAFGVVAQKRIWMRELHPLVDDEPLTPFLRAASASDFAHPFANSGLGGLEFINADISLYLLRDPVGEWIGFEVTNHQSADGIALGVTELYDEQGPIGQSSVCAVANRRGPGAPGAPASKSS